MKKALFALLFLLFTSCSQSSGFSKKTYKVGIDPSFFPSELGEQRTNVYTFAYDVLTHIAKMNNVQIQIVDLSWDNLFDEMYLGRVDAIISGAPPTLINANKFAFSDPLIRTGPVLVVPITSKVSNLKSLLGKVVAIPHGNGEIEIIGNYPETEFIFYDRFTSALELVTLGNIQGTLIPIVPAARYVQDIFSDSLKIVTTPLTNDALRLLIPINTMEMAKIDKNIKFDSRIKENREELFAMFNKGITKMLDDGEYHKSLHKWNLSQ